MTSFKRQAKKNPDVISAEMREVTSAIPDASVEPSPEKGSLPSGKKTLFSRTGRTTVPESQHNPIDQPSDSPIDLPDNGKISAGKKNSFFSKKKASNSTSNLAEKDNKKSEKKLSFFSKKKGDAGKAETDTDRNSQNEGKKTRFKIPSLRKAKNSPDAPKVIISKQGKVPPKEKPTHLIIETKHNDQIQLFTFEITNGKAMPCPENFDKKSSTVISFTSGDFSKTYDGSSLSQKKAKDLFIGSFEDDNISLIIDKKNKNCYASESTRVNEYGRMYAGMQLLQTVLQIHKPDYEFQHNQSRLSAITFSDGDDGFAKNLLLILESDAGLQEIFFYARVDVNDIQEKLHNFVRDHTNQIDGENILLISFEDEILSIIDKNFPSYPKKSGLINLQDIASISIILLSVASTGVLAACVNYKFANDKIKADITSIEKQITENKRIQKEISSSSVKGLAQSQSVDISNSFDIAGKIWLPRTKIQINGNVEKTVFVVQMPITSTGLFNGRPSVLQSINAQEINPLLQLKVPEGCTKEVPAVNGTIDSLNVTVECTPKSIPIALSKIGK